MEQQTYQEVIRDDPDRPRRIVGLAAAQKSSARQWLRLDEFGTWELRAASYWAMTAKKRASLGMSDAEAEGQIASMLVLDALNALIERAKRQPAPERTKLATPKKRK